MTSATIALITSHLFARNDGQGRVNYEIARAALNEGFRLCILAMRCDEDLAADPAVEYVELNHESLPTQILRNAAFARSASRWLRTHQKDYDLIHASGYVTAVPADVNTAHMVHSGWIKSPAYPFSWQGGAYSAYQRFYTLRNAYLEKAAYIGARQVVAVSQKIADELRGIGVKEERLSVIYNGVDIQEFRPGVRDRARFGLPEDSMIFLFAGNIRTPGKGLDTVLAALTATPGVHLAVAGALEGSPFPAQTEARGLAERVHFLGHVAEMPTLMQACDAFVFPSRYDALGLVLLEAMASGLPVLTARTAGGAEILGEGGRVLDDPNDTATLAQWMRDLAGDALLRQRMGEAGREIAERYTWDRMAAAYLALYDELLSTKKSPGPVYRQSVS
ncbi:glycosyltransferase family 4 protein [Acidithiobacillus ferrooxidans]|uniref:glycosyltransferase family 4 protein n=1 Tax=Acidithiobacillus ferrooxidans TaxID=920 RepID=UPI001C06FF88|nr:glycosyltransferase family 4 protein [Acidithiobacillus ferrooxidans]MBU2774311.1 glycosyltransferase family 4 protein [Acidithiobacillus ferrooxidans]